jgi:hypothetical protein
MEELAVAKYSEPVGKNTGLVFDLETGEKVMVGELKKRQANRAAAKKNGVANNGPPPENAEHPEEYVANAGLPKGWKKIQLKKNPDVQWYENEATGEEQWFRPGNLNSTSVVLEDEPGLQPGWQRAYNSRNKKTPKAIWYEHQNGRTQWERPAGSNINASANANKPNVAAVSSPKSSNNALGNLKSQINNLGATLNEMQRTLTKSGGRRKRRNTRRSKTRKSRK